MELIDQPAPVSDHFAKSVIKSFAYLTAVIRR